MKYIKKYPTLVRKLLERIGNIFDLWKSFTVVIKNRYQKLPPIPPSNLRFLVAGTNDVSWFIKSGQLAAQSIRDILNKHGIKIDDFRSFLDFGCGAGRVIRYWHKVNVPEIHGTDYNPALIEWCRENLPFAHFQVNPMAGSLNYEDEKFDFIYALSVFTHLTETHQFFWINELNRVLKPEGYLFITIHGEKYYLPQLLPEDQARFQRGELIVYGGDREGSNICTVFHPDVFVRSKMARDFIVVDHIPEGALGNPCQDVYLLKKKK